MENDKELQDLRQFAIRLLTLLSHQIKAPLGIIKGHTSNLRNEMYGEMGEKAKGVLGQIELSANDLIRLAENIIDIKRIEDGKVVYRFKRTDFCALAEEVAAIFAPVAAAKGLEWQTAFSKRSVFVNADGHYLKHVIENLLDNAIKYTPSGFICVSVEEKDGRVIFSVQDSGMGIKPGTSPLLFEEFIRDERVDSAIKGSGLGLYIAKSIAEAHGGKVFAESEGEGKGSVFGFNLPLA